MTSVVRSFLDCGRVLFEYSAEDPKKLVVREAGEGDLCDIAEYLDHSKVMYAFMQVQPSPLPQSSNPSSNASSSLFSAARKHLQQRAMQFCITKR